MARRRKPVYRIHTFPLPEDKQLDILCLIAFGMNADLAVRDIRQNKGGKYDCLYKKEEKVS